nr:hypothetical protein [Alphaproteobacteria bacterium]
SPSCCVSYVLYSSLSPLLFILQHSETGSYDLFTGPVFGAQRNSSVVISGKDTDKNMIEIISDIWVNIPYYTNLKTKYTYITEKFLNYKENFLLEPREFSPGQYLYALRTPEAHSVFLNDFFKNAKTNIVMISPFIRLDKLKKIFEDSILDDFEKRGVNVTLVTLYFPCSNHEERKEIFSQLMTLKKKYPRFSYITQSNVHAKTLISDDWICEGSFNWLSAVEDIQHKAHNFEFSLGIKGDAAKNLIESFYKTEIGKTILLGTTKAVIQKKRVIRQNTFPMIKEDSESSKKMRGENFTPSSIQPTFNFPSEPNNRIHLSPSNNIIFPSNSNNILPSLSPESVSTESKLPN